MKKIISMLLVVTAFMPVLSASAAPHRHCRHQHTVSTYSYSRYEQVRNNPNVHKETKYYNKQCKSCRATIAKNVKGNTNTEAHNFRGNKCKDCGAVKKAHIPVVKPPVVKPPVKPIPRKDTTRPSIVSLVSSKGTNFFFGNDSVKISASATDNVKVSKMVCFLDGRQISQTASNKLSINIDGRKLTAGVHNVKVVTYDEAGNESSKTLTLNVKSSIKINGFNRR